METLRQDFGVSDQSGVRTHSPNGSMPSQAISVVPHFYMDTQVDGMASAKAGRLVYKSVEMVLITFAGASSQTIRRKVLDHDRIEYRAHYERFKEGTKEVKLDGTDLRGWPMIDRATAETLAAMNVRTVEQLANLSDTDIMSLGMNGRPLRQKAIDWLQISSGASEAMAMADQIRQLQEQLAATQQQNKVLEDRVTAANRISQMINASAGQNAMSADDLAQVADMQERDQGPSPEMARMLAEANGLNPDLVRATHAAQEAQDHRMATDIPIHIPEPIQEPNVELPELPVNPSVID